MDIRPAPDRGRGDPACPLDQPGLGLGGRKAAELEDLVEAQSPASEGAGDTGKLLQGVSGADPAARRPGGYSEPARQPLGHVPAAVLGPAPGRVTLRHMAQQLQLPTADTCVELVDVGDRQVSCACMIVRHPSTSRPRPSPSSVS
jgi:hypothetical protein